VVTNKQKTKIVEYKTSSDSDEINPDSNTLSYEELKNLINEAEIPVDSSKTTFDDYSTITDSSDTQEEDFATESSNKLIQANSNTLSSNML
jgi:hypothetical protein